MENQGSHTDEKAGPAFRWLGTADFRMAYGGKVILIDPDLTRNDRARPVQPLRPADMSDADYAFLSHGHFDHLRDTPAIVTASGAGHPLRPRGHGCPRHAVRGAGIRFRVRPIRPATLFAWSTPTLLR